MYIRLLHWYAAWQASGTETLVRQQRSGKATSPHPAGPGPGNQVNSFRWQGHAIKVKSQMERNTILFWRVTRKGAKFFHVCVGHVMLAAYFWLTVSYCVRSAIRVCYESRHKALQRT